MKIHSLIKIYTSLCFLLVLSTCALLVKPHEEPILDQLSAGKINAYDWLDDLNFEGIEQAVEQSLRYYRRLPAGHSFHYNDLHYSAEEMADSLSLFLKTVRDYQGRERLEQIKNKFIFFESRNTAGQAFFTGYYEPVIEGSPVPAERFQEPLYETPADLITVDLGQFSEELKHEIIIGRLDGKQLVPYDSREEIVYGKSLKDRARPLAFVEEIDLFFLQIQGSGLVKLTDGSVKRVNYAQKNGHPYRAIGRILKDKIPPDKMSLQSIKQYLYAHPGEVRKILSYNQSYIFFRETGEGPLGDIEVPLTPGRSIAMDRRVVPRGSLAFIETELPVFDNGRITEWKPVKRFALVQDTGGAIRDHGRVDLFFGNGDNAELSAGHMKQAGRAFLFVARKEFLGQQ